MKFICGIVVGIFLGSATVVGANQAIQAIQNSQIKINLNGIVQEFRDETTGELQLPLTFHNRTYLPLRNVAQLSGLDVDYDNETIDKIKVKIIITTPTNMDVRPINRRAFLPLFCFISHHPVSYIICRTQGL